MVEGSRPIRYHGHPFRRHAGVFQPGRKLIASQARDRNVLQPLRDTFEVDIP
jgi:hypothetical protein